MWWRTFMVKRDFHPMNPRGIFNPLAMLAALAAVVLPAAAEDGDLETLVKRANAAMHAERWQEALASSTAAVERFGKDDPLRNYGAQFGAVHYRKGICEMKLKHWDEAMRSFEICYRDFPNHGATAENGNVFQKMALLKWGEAAMAAENWELAISRFSKFTVERDKRRDAFPQGVFYISNAVCHYRLGRIPEGNENLEIAIRNQRLFSTPDEGIIGGFQALATAAVSQRNEQALLDFIGKNRGELMMEPALMHHYSRVFLKLAGDAAASGMTRAAFALYSFVPDTQAALDDAKARNFPEKEITNLEAELSGKNPPEMIKLAAVAYLHEKNGNLRGAIAAYQQLETHFPHSGNREANFFNLIRTSSRADHSDRVRTDAATFIHDFPNSSHVPELRTLLEGALQP
jgi:outer membrane protein assembly factor BamD (BamD/ComL family)